jgi:eukaryotic-like serine/threonine-protein kinase
MSDPRPTTRPPRGQRPYTAEEMGRVAALVLGEPKIATPVQPDRIGPYLVEATIGEGGMGVVYRARQFEPIQRTVAIKVIKFGMDTREVIARFESEKQTLTLLDHPHIAKVLDAGATDSGVPYFVMEYVDGEPITAFADRMELTVTQRLELFLQACQAVQHAHLKAIIHRDLKPSNILVMNQDDMPWVKVIDFGIAKAIDRSATARALFTEAGQLVGTPEYMAPEQADDRPADVDTRADVYSLGVVLYELLSGSLPLEPRTVRGAGYAEMRRVIREVDPPRPSTRLSKLGAEGGEVARRRRLSVTALEQQLQHELEWIPLKALRKEPAERYSSASDLATDVANYMNDRPLDAGPESSAYRLRKLLRRHRGAVAAGVAIVLLLLAGVVATSWQAIRAGRAEARAVLERNEAQAQRGRAEAALESVREVNRFLTDDLLLPASPEIARGKEMTVREAVDRAADSIGKRPKVSTTTQAAIRAALADVYASLGLFEQALPHARAAAELFRSDRGADDEQTLTADHEVGRELAMLDRQAEAEPMLRDVLARSTKLLGADHPVALVTMGSLGMTLRLQNRFDEAELYYRAALDGDGRVHGMRSEQRSRALNSLALLLVMKGNRTDAEPLYRESLDIKREVLGIDHPGYLTTLGNLARVVTDQGKLEEAEQLTLNLLAEDRRVLGDDHPSTLLTLNNLGTLLQMRSKFAESEVVCREALERRRRVLGEEHRDTLMSISNLGSILLRQSKFAEAEPLVIEAYEKRRRVLGETHAQTVVSATNFARLYDLTDRPEKAEPLWAWLTSPEVLAAQLVPQQAVVLARFGSALVRRGKLVQAEPLLIDAERRLRETKQEKGDVMREVLRSLAQLNTATGHADAAERWARAAAELDAATRPATSPVTISATSPATH